MQEEVGLQSITDGEFRRGSWFLGFVEAVEGLGVTDAPFEFHDGAGGTARFQTACVEGKLRRVRGITTVFNDAHTRAVIACRLLHLLDRSDIPVAAGAAPRDKPEIAGQFQYGLRPAFRKRPVKESAVEFLYSQLKARPGEITVVATVSASTPARVRWIVWYSPRIQGSNWSR